MSVQRVYLAGPMTGLPQFNFPAFDAAAKYLRDTLGWEVVSPAELDSPEHREIALSSDTGEIQEYRAATGDEWSDLLARDIGIITDGSITGVVVLPRWDESRGARLETYVASAIERLPVWRLNDLKLTAGTALPVGRDELMRAWAAEDVLPEGPPPKPAHAEVRVTSSTGGEKGRKPERMDLLPWNALLDIARVYDFGACKYDANNWRLGYDYGLSYGALMRHLAAWWEGEDCDRESGLSHLAHAGFHVLTLLTFTGADRYGCHDDRPARSPA